MTIKNIRHQKRKEKSTWHQHQLNRLLVAQYKKKLVEWGKTCNFFMGHRDEKILKVKFK